VTEQRVEDVLKAVLMSYLDLLPPDQRAPLFARVSGQILEKLSRRDTQRVHVIPREDPSGT